MSPEEAVTRESENAEFMTEWRQYLGRIGTAGDLTRLYCCGAGITGFHVNPRGGLQACLMVPTPEYSLVDGHFAAGWRSIVEDMRSRSIAADSPCRRCDKKNVCGYCPGFFLADSGDETKRSDYLCAIGQCRAKMLQNA